LTISSELVSPLETRIARRSWRVLAIGALGPLTILAGIVWATAQPYRLTVLQPRGKGFWELVVEPPLLVVVVGLVFALVVARGLVADLDRAEDDAAP
jgi:hypothetical protein